MILFKKTIFFFCFIFSTFFSFSQSYLIKGNIIDSDTKQPLAFVNIGIVGTQIGTSADIDGKFSIAITTEKATLNFSYVGYEIQKIEVTKNSGEKDLIVKLKRKAYQLNEVKIVAGENPAHRIIKRVTANRDINNPEKMRSFFYNSYNKLYVTADFKAGPDTLNGYDTLKTARNYFKKQHLFLMESVSERKFKRPASNSEKIIASRTSGFKNSPFALLATQLQSFSFYDEDVMVLDRRYLNPISKGSTTKYFFQMEDTTYTGADTVFIISFRPLRGKKFDGLKGVLYINTNTYAVQNVITEPAEKNNSVSIKIQQKYEFLENKQWFPMQINTDWYYNNVTFGDSSITASAGGKSDTIPKDESMNKLKVVGRSYLKNVQLDPELKRKEFGRFDIEFAPDATEKDEKFWNQYRVDTLSVKDSMTYHVVDSIGKKEKFDQKLKTFEAFFSGKLRVKKIDIDLNKILNANEFEGLRLGAGLHTNERLSKYFAVGGYAAYGFKDKAFKYGGDATIFLHKNTESKLKFMYSQDVFESASNIFLTEERLLSTESYRQYFVSKMDSIQKAEVSFSFRPIRHLKLDFFVNQQNRIVTNDYKFGYSSESVSILFDQYKLAEYGVAGRFAFREKFMNMPNQIISLGSDYPIVYFKLTKGTTSFLDGQYDYFKYELKAEKTFYKRNFGTTTFQLNAGKVEGNIPYTLLFNGKGSYRGTGFKNFSISSQNSFETMGYNEFTMSEYASLFLYHNFGTVIKKKKFRPSIAISNGIGFGKLSNVNNHFGISTSTIDKGFYESGLHLNGLISSSITKFGVAGFYRYGPYSQSDWQKNVAIKMTIGISF